MGGWVGGRGDCLLFCVGDEVTGRGAQSEQGSAYEVIDALASVGAVGGWVGGWVVGR